MPHTPKQFPKQFGDFEPATDAVAKGVLSSAGFATNLTDKPTYQPSLFTLGLNSSLLKLRRNHSPNCKCPACCN